MGRLHTRYSPVRRSHPEGDLPRLACVRPVASVHPEPGSNSSLYFLIFIMVALFPDTPKLALMAPTNIDLFELTRFVLLFLPKWLNFDFTLSKIIAKRFGAFFATFFRFSGCKDSEFGNKMQNYQTIYSTVLPFSLLFILICYPQLSFYHHNTDKNWKFRTLDTEVCVPHTHTFHAK